MGSINPIHPLSEECYQVQADLLSVPPVCTSLDDFNYLQIPSTTDVCKYTVTIVDKQY